MWTFLLSLGIAYVGMAAGLSLLQSRLLHLPDTPGRELTATPAQVNLAYESVIIPTADGVRLHGWFIPAAEPGKTLLFFHGNAGNISHRLDALAIFHRLDLNVLIIDYRGYGRSEGSPSEQGLYQDAEAAWRYLRREKGVAARDIVLYGHSLGGAVAAWLAARQTPGALIVESSFTSIPDIAAELYWFLPARLLARLRYDTLENIRQVNCPVLIIHSRDDEIIPFEHGRRLFEAAREPKRLLAIHGDHNGGFLLSQPRYEQGVRTFLDAYVRSKSAPPPGGSPEPAPRGSLLRFGHSAEIGRPAGGTGGNHGGGVKSGFMAASVALQRARTGDFAGPIMGLFFQGFL